jgi:hypothetical protein
MPSTVPNASFHTSTFPQKAVHFLYKKAANQQLLFSEKNLKNPEIKHHQTTYYTKVSVAPKKTTNHLYNAF